MIGRRYLLVAGLLLAAAPPARPQFGFDQRNLAPYVPTPQDIVEKMLDLAGVKKGEMVYDLGCGDGRILVTAAQKFGARATGVELDAELYRKTTAHIAELKLQDRIKLINGNLLEADLSGADVVTLYLLTDSNTKLRPNLEKYLKAGARVISHDFVILGWVPHRTEKIESGRTHYLYLYVMPPLTEDH